MPSKLRTRKKKSKEELPSFSPVEGLFASRPFTAQTKPVTAQTKPAAAQQPPDLGSSWQKAARFGHHLEQISVFPKGQVSTAVASKPQSIQTKPTVGEPGDKYEHEADAVAAQVVDRLETADSFSPRKKRRSKDETEQSINQNIQTPVQTKSNESATINHSLEQGIEGARGRGQALSDDVREPMEQSFDADFRGVNIHTDAESDQLNRSIHARAFTTGQDIFFKQDEYNPQTKDGKEILAHELTHVVQQNPSTVQRKATSSVQPISQSSLAIQRLLIPKSQRAFTTAKGQNPSYATGEALVDGQIEGRDNATESEQKKITNLRGAKSIVSSAEPEKRLKDFVRAYLLREFAARTSKLTNAKAPTEKERKAKRDIYLSKALRLRDMYKPLLGKGVEAPETQAFLGQNGFTIALTDKQKRKELKKVAKGPRIDVRSTFIGGPVLGMDLRAHLFIVYTSEEGRQIYFRGGPGDDNFTIAEMGIYTPDTIDYDPSAPSINVLKGANAKAKLPALIEAASIINGMKVPYISHSGVLDGENCNSVAWTILTRAGIAPKKPLGVHPGWGHILGASSKQGNAVPDKEDETQKPGTDYTLPQADTQMVDVYLDSFYAEKAGQLAGQSQVSVVEEGRTFLKIKYNGGIGYIRKTNAEQKAFIRNEVVFYTDAWSLDTLIWIVTNAAKDKAALACVKQVAESLNLDDRSVHEAMGSILKDREAEQQRLEDEAAKRIDRLKTIGMHDEYKGEELRAGNWRSHWAKAGNDPNSPNVTTKYYSPEEREQSRVHIGLGGRLETASGDLLDTSGRNVKRSAVNQKMKHPEMGYVMSPEGHVHVFDGGYDHPDDKTQTGVHHSSIMAGGQVAAAGSISTEKGVIKEITDASGHYKPKGEYTYQAVKRLHEQGAAMEQLVRDPDTGMVGPSSAKVTLLNKPILDKDDKLVSKVKEGDISLRYQQFLQTGGNERQIRHKAQLNQEIASFDPSRLKPPSSSPKQAPVQDVQEQKAQPQLTVSEPQATHYEPQLQPTVYEPQATHYEPQLQPTVSEPQATHYEPQPQPTVYEQAPHRQQVTYENDSQPQPTVYENQEQLLQPQPTVYENQEQLSQPQVIYEQQPQEILDDRRPMRRRR